MTNALVVTLDVRDMIPRDRHPMVFARFDALGAGDILRLVNDHDPVPLHNQLQARRAGQLNWQYEEQGPEEWIVRIQKLAPEIR